MASIWVPEAHTDREAWKIHQAVRQYDEDLAFGRNEETGQWCIFMRQGTREAASTRDLPILGFDHIPSADEAIERLWRSDSRKRGEEILKELNEHNENIQAKRKQAADDAIGQTAEAFEWGYRKMGKHPSTRIFIPGKGLV